MPGVRGVSNRDCHIWELTFQCVWNKDITEAWRFAECKQGSCIFIRLDESKRFIGWVQGEQHIWQVYKLCYVLDVVDKGGYESAPCCGVAHCQLAVAHVYAIAAGVLQELHEKAGLVPKTEHGVEELIVHLSEWRALLLQVSIQGLLAALLFPQAELALICRQRSDRLRSQFPVARTGKAWNFSKERRPEQGKEQQDWDNLHNPSLNAWAESAMACGHRLT